jgi:PAS domain S-box-containing protein
MSDASALQVRNDLYELLARSNRAVRECRSREALFAEVCRVAIETGHFRFVWVGQRDAQRRVRKVASAGDDQGYLDEVTILTVPEDVRSTGPTGRAYLSGTSVVVNDFQASPITTPWHGPAARVGFKASATFPFWDHGQVVAVFTLYASEKGFFTDELVATLDELAPVVSFGLERFTIEERRARDEAMLRLRERAINAVSQGLVMADARDPHLPIVYVSPGFERMTGYTAAETLGRNCRFLQGKDTDRAAVAEIRQALSQGRACNVDVLNYRKDDTPFWNALSLSPVVDDAGQLTHFIGVQTEITQHRKLEAQLRQAQKMEAVGQLAAGVAHDFNNLLSVVMSYTSLAIDALPAVDPLRDDLDEVRRAGSRATELTRRLLAFSRQQVLQPRVIELSSEVLGFEKMLHPLMSEDVTITFLPARERCCVLADPTGLEQVVMNLAVNARDAMPEGGALRIGIEAFDGKPADGLPAGHWGVLSVTDTGVGMSAATRERLFEPFFTTKDKGKGTGLGLSTVFGIVSQSGGHVLVDSEEGRGATFKVYLPRVDEATELAMPARAPAQDLRGTETILLVEDDELVRRATRSVLHRHGYTVLDAQNGGEALLICEQAKEPISLLLSDMVMPRMNGAQLATRLKQLKPELKVLFMSGYAPTSSGSRSVVGLGEELLLKPVVPQALLRAVRAALDAPLKLTR